MAISLRSATDRIRGRIRDTDAKNQTFDRIEVQQAICEAYIGLQGQLPRPSIYQAAAFTISAGGDTFSLPATVTQYTGGDGGAEYAGDVRIRLVSDGRYLTRRTLEEIDSLRWGHPTVTLGKPRDFALWEEKDQTVQGRCYPGALAAESCDLFVTLDADDLRDFIGSGADDMDDVELLMSRRAANALVIHTSADLVARMTDEDLGRRRLNPNVVTLWHEEAQRGLYQEAVRKHRLEDVGRLQRWVG